MPLKPETQRRLDETARRLIVEVEAIGHFDQTQTTLIPMIERHLLGLFGALKQLDPRFEQHVVRGLRRYLDGYEAEPANRSKRTSKGGAKRK